MGLGLDVVERRLGHVDGALPLAVGLAAPLTVHVDSHVEEAGGGHLRGAGVLVRTGHPRGAEAA